MVLIKSIKAIDLLCVLSAELGGVYEDLYFQILKNGKEDALDDWMSMEFPHGTDREEYRDFFRDNQDEIYENLGIRIFYHKNGKIRKCTL